MKKLAAALALGAMFLASCGSSEQPAPSGGGEGDDKPAACSASGTALKLVAKDTKFDQSCLAVTSGEAFTIDLDNQDDLPHNVSIYKSKEHKDRIFEGKPLAEGKKTVSYAVPAIDETGTFHFMCDIHPEMEGDFVVE